MRRLAFFLLVASLCLSQQSSAGWQSRDSNYNIKVTAGGGGGYTGLGDLGLSQTVKGYWGVRAYNNAFSGSIFNLCDSSGANCANVTWTAGALGTMANGTGTCDNSGNICSVHTAYDTSGAHNCALSTTCDMVEDGAVATWPTIVMSCLGTSGPCLRFTSASNQRLHVGVSLGAGLWVSVAQPWNIVGVVRQLASGISSYFIGDQNGTGGGQYFINSHLKWFAGSGVLSITMSDAQNHSTIMSARGASSNSFTVIDGSLTTSSDAGTNAFGNNSNPIEMGNQRQDYINPFDGYVFELSVFDGSVFASGDYGAICHNQYLYYGSTFPTSC